TQHNSPYLDNLNNQGNERRRMVQVNYASMSGNGRNGIDIGMDALQEGGNLQHGDEVATDVYVTINNADILNNAGDGLEFLGDDTFEVGRVPGGGQDVAAIYNSAVQLLNSRVASNRGRGIDILNRHQSDVFVTIRNNDVLGNGLEGIYVVNTASINQLQGTSADPLTVYIDGVNTANPNMELRIQDNLIQSNGDRSRSSRVPTRFEFGNNDASGVANLDWGPATTFVAGTLGGLVVRAGTAESAGTIRVGTPGLELGRAGVDAEVWNNLFDGNVGADVFFDNFVSHMPLQSQGLFDASHTPRFRWDQGFRDPLSRFDLSFRGNIGNSLDVMN
ncbi:MAG: right-handed parallel beta-helix repeat-containing protein, partial [Planctomycetaceae bacterium]